MLSTRTENIHRSLRQMVSVALGSPPWIVRLADEIPQESVQRPVAYVELAAPARTIQARGSLPQGAVLRTATWRVTAVPAIGANPRISAQEADGIQTVVSTMLSGGISVATAEATPLHVPIFDWSAVPLEGSLRELPSTAIPLIWANVQPGYEVQIVPDPEDPKRFSVLAEFTLEWWDAGASGPTAEGSEFTGAFKP